MALFDWQIQRQKRGLSQIPAHCVAKCDYQSSKDSGLSFKTGDIIQFLQKDGDHVKGSCKYV